jgi:hypothetical protein
MAQRFFCRLILAGAKYPRIPSRGGWGSSADIKGIYANGNLLHLDNIANLEWYYNNTLNKLTKADKTTQYNVYDYQGNRVRTVIESNQLFGWMVRVCCQAPLFAW